MRSSGRDGRKPDEINEYRDTWVFMIVQDRNCSRCGGDMPRGSMAFNRGEEHLCLKCAGMDHLVFLPRGNMALSRRARKYSSTSAVVVRFARARRRYERQGVLVEEEALARAEKECAADELKRKDRRKKEEKRRDAWELEYVAAFAAAVRSRYPGCPRGVEFKIAAHACEKYSGRVGRIAAAKELDAKAIDLAVKAHVRHCCTEYDRLIKMGYEKFEARQMARAEVDRVLIEWATPRKKDRPSG
ncbi:MAG TPA: DUF2293 domain-containing protein [bacterium]|nr:DUF2293 domain-containing protein [bacterium]